MDPGNLCYLSVGQLSRLIKNREVSPVEIVEAHLARVEALEPMLNSFITLRLDQAMEDAQKVEEEIKAGRYRGPLHGIPCGLKDLFYVKGIRNTSGCKVFEGFTPDFDSAIAAKVKAAGAIILGKLNLHQLAYGPTGENPDYGPMHNPWNPERITGGSSGGSGAATASGECAFSLGTDTGGSIRIPSALCGLAGLKPTYGRLSRYGITVLSWSQDHAGPMARNVEDCALVMNAVAGYDPKDSSSANIPVPDFTQALMGDIRDLRVGVPKEVFEDPIDSEVEDSVRKAIECLSKLGAAIREVSWPMYQLSKPLASTVQMAEATAYHRQLIKEHHNQIDFQVRLRLDAGFFVSAVDYLQAQRARQLFYQGSCDLFKEVDLLAGPTVPVAAFKIGTRELKVGTTHMGVISALTQCTRPFNLNGFPAITVPCGFSKEGLPMGLQLAGKPFDEKTVLRAAHAYEQATEWHERRPVVLTGKCPSSPTR
jgi:aspartyl-tRNA(Asn)/glutamyl-tRNA(Gln) amidotransferase subunit A